MPWNLFRNVVGSKKRQAGRPSRKAPASARLGIETLERRELMASQLTASLAGGVLRVEGTEGADTIRVLQQNDQIRVEGAAIQTGSGSLASVPTTAVESVRIEPLGGTDHIWLADAVQRLTALVTLGAGAGSDQVHVGGDASGFAVPGDAAGGLTGVGPQSSQPCVYGLHHDGTLSTYYGGYSGTKATGVRQIASLPDGRIAVLFADGRLSNTDGGGWQDIASRGWGVGERFFYLDGGNYLYHYQSGMAGFVLASNYRVQNVWVMGTGLVWQEQGKHLYQWANGAREADQLTQYGVWVMGDRVFYVDPGSYLYQAKAGDDRFVQVSYHLIDEARITGSGFVWREQGTQLYRWAFDASGYTAVTDFGPDDYVVVNGFTLHGEIAEKCLAMNGSLGLPTGEQFAARGSIVQHFQYGGIYVNGGQVIVIGDRNVWQEYRARGGEWGTLGLPTSNGVEFSPGDWGHRFERGIISWSPTAGVGVVESQLTAFLAAPPTTLTQVGTLRPTLLVLTHGAQHGEHQIEEWQTAAARAFCTQLEAAGSQTYTMLVDWPATFAPTTSTARRIAAKIDDFLQQRASEKWDVILVGHSRGGILNHEVARNLGKPARLGDLMHVMLDPTAWEGRGDVYPTGMPGTVTKSIHYDDNRKWMVGGIGIGAATREGEDIPGIHETVNVTPAWPP